MLAITGTSGFIGKYICSHLPFPQKKLFSSTVSAYLLEEGNCSTTVTYPDNDLSLFVKETDTLLHLACKSNPRKTMLTSQEDLHFTTRLFESFALANPNGHIIFASTGGNMYDSGLPYVPRTEKDLPVPHSSYSIQKLAAEHYLRLMCQTYGISATVLRISNPYGTLLEPERLQGLIGIAFSKILLNQPLTIFDSPESIRDYIHLDDVTSAFQTVIQHKPAKGTFRLYNVGYGIGHSLNQVIQLIESASARTLEINYSESSHMIKPSWSVLSYTHFESELGWKPNISLEVGLKKMWRTIQSISNSVASHES